MPSLPLVTIITPSFNQAAFLEQAICSVLGQDYPAIEYLVIDGGSNDGSRDIIERYSDRLAWWVSEPDSGQAEAINKGFQRARGDFVAWLNSDDLYLPGAVSQAVEALNAEPGVGMVYGDAITIDSSGKPLGRFIFDDWGLIDLVSFRIICQPAVFMRRSILELAGGLDRTYHFMLDHQLWIRMARLAPIRHIPARLIDPARPVEGLWAAARHHPGAKNISQAAGFGTETLKVLDWMEAEPDLCSLIRKHRSRVLAGAYRLNARYLLDAGLAWKSLLSYGKALGYRPSLALKHWHRMLYAGLSLFKIERLADPLIYRIEARHRQRLTAALNHTCIARVPALDESPAEPFKLAGWPGLSLNNLPRSNHD